MIICSGRMVSLLLMQQLLKISNIKIIFSVLFNALSKIMLPILIITIIIVIVIVVTLSCKRSEVGNFLPMIHQSMTNLIRSLEFEVGNNKVNIYCSAHTPKYRPHRKSLHLLDEKLTPIYEYNLFFHNTTTTTRSSPMIANPNLASYHIINPPKDLLPLLIPEYYHHSYYQKIPLIEKTRFENEVIQMNMIGEGAGGVVYHGKKIGDDDDYLMSLIRW
jgi:hypothetical protein